MCLPAKAEADKLAWDIPRGAKVGVVASDSPAEKAGMKGGDIILSIEWMMVETGSDADAAVAAKRPSEELRLRSLRQQRAPADNERLQTTQHHG